MRIAITGASGLVGSALCPRLEADGHTLVRISRTPAPDVVSWDVASGKLDAESLAGVDAVVHLAGESIMGRWTDDKKRAIRDSRIMGTRLIAETMARINPKPRMLVSASAIGIYGPKRDGFVDTNSPPGDGFLASVCRDWEAATDAASAAGIRVAHVRVGVVLAEGGGALAQLLPIFRAGLGGPIGKGERQLSWISLHDVARVFQFALTHPISGAVNAVAPNPVDNTTFTKALSEALKRPACVPVPPIALKLMYGEMASETILSDVAVQPYELREAGFHFDHPELPCALAHELNKH